MTPESPVDAAGRAAALVAVGATGRFAGGGAGGRGIDLGFGMAGGGVTTCGTVACGAGG